MKVYIAGASGEMDRARDVFALVRGSEDLTIAHDWIAQIEDVGAANPMVPEIQRRAWSQDALERVRTSPILWLLLPEVPTVGAWCELTAGVIYHRLMEGPRRLIVTSGSDAARYRSIFTSLADKHFETDAEALRHLRIYAARF